MKRTTRFCLLAALAAALSSSPAGAARAKGRAADTAAPKSGTVDLNTASAKQLEALPGIGAATAKKIIAHRPYASVQDLSKAGVSKKTIDEVAPMVTVGAAAATSPMVPPRPEPRANQADKTARADRASAPSPGAPSKSSPVDLNTASQADIEKLPGIGPVKAKKIVANRPYASVQDLSKAGVSKKTIDEVTPMVTVGAAAATSPMASSRPEARAKNGDRASPSSAGAPTKSSPVDLNTASQADIERLPGIGPVKAKKIIAARPYASTADLRRAGLSAKEVTEITPLVTVTGAGGASTPMGTADKPMRTPPPPVTTASPRTSTPANAGGETSASATPPSPGMVWVNTDTKIYHLEGDRWYGHTRHGRWMTEQDAMQAGYRKAKK